MDFVLNILWFLGGLAAFLFGMKLVSDYMERVAGKGLRKLFDKITSNRLIGVGVGAGFTAVIQSSSATSVVVLGFVNNGMMTLYQATTVLMGAAIGTTVTGIVVSLQALPIAEFIAALSLVGVFMMMLSKNDKVKNIGGMIVGFGILFIGLELMSQGAEHFKDIFSDVFQTLNNPFLLLLLGILFTALIQSSSAMTGIVITLAGVGAIPLLSALYIVVGSNVGTCITAFIACVGGNINTKRTAVIQLLIKIFVMLVCLPFLLFLGGQISKFFMMVTFGEISMAVALFHVVSNVITIAILLPFVKPIVNLVEKIMPERKKKGEQIPEFKLSYLDERMLSTPSIAVAQIKNELSGMAERAFTNVGLAMNRLLRRDDSFRAAFDKNEETIDYINQAIPDFLVKLTVLNVNQKDEAFLGSVYHVVADIERIGDHAKNIYGYGDELDQAGQSFSEAAVAELDSMLQIIQKMFPLAIGIFATMKTKDIPLIHELENEVDRMKDRFAAAHIVRLNQGICTVENGASFFNTLTDLERIADHLHNIALSIVPRKLKERASLMKDYSILTESSDAKPKKKKADEKAVKEMEAAEEREGTL